MRVWFIIGVLLLAGCMQLPQPQLTTPEPTTILQEETSVPLPDVAVSDVPIKRVKAGEEVSFPNLIARDPDGDPVTYEFSYPLSQDGTWQTGPGDEGEYNTTIIASDGETRVQQVVRIIVEYANEPPLIENVRDITVFEGEVVNISPRVIDRDRDQVTVRFTGWKSEFPYTTTHNDAGVHSVMILASDGYHTTERLVTVTVENVNRPPVLHKFNEVAIIEGDHIEVRPDAEDPDGDKLTFSFSAPLNATGAWETKIGDAGFYVVNVTVFDGTFMDTTKLELRVLEFNAKPTITPLPDLLVKEGDMIDVQVEAQDPEDADLSIRFSGWMNSHTRQVTFEDAGTHLVTVSVSDGVNEVNESFEVVVENNNRPPSFGPGSFS